jgi:hypothetical protein
MDVMNKTFGWLTAIVLAGAVAMPTNALAQHKQGNAAGGGDGGKAAAGSGGGHAAPAGGGGGRSFGGGGGQPAFRAPAPHYSAPVHRSAPVVRAPVRVAPSSGLATRYSTPQFSTTSRSRVHIQQQNSAANQLRLQQRQERLLHRAETRQLRALPPQQRAARRLELQNARQLRAQQHLQVQPSVQAHTLRRDGRARVTQQAARQGRFASRFTANAGVANIAAHRAWRHHRRAGFVSWYGPVFWPYAYYDLFGYAFWPYGYDDAFWFTAYDDFFDGVFWGEVGPPVDYGYGYAAARRAPRASYASVQELCKQPGSGVTAWPFADIERKVGLNDEQKQLLDDMRKASGDAAASFKASCPAENIYPMTPPGRLTAMTARLDATLGAVQTVKPALEKFYTSLSDEQKERFNAIGPKAPKDNAKVSLAAVPEAKSCKEQKPGLTNLPIERIEDAVKPTEAQQADLKGLEEATAKAVSIMQAACPDETPITPPGRLEAMEKRLQAMIDAAKTVKPALESFYGSLSSEQKARFNRIGQQLAQAD